MQAPHAVEGPKASVRERYEEGVNKIVGGDDIEADPEIVAPRSESARRKRAATLKRVDANFTGHEHPPDFTGRRQPTASKTFVQTRR